MNAKMNTYIASLGFTVLSCFSVIGQSYNGDATEIAKISKNLKDFSSYVMNSDYQSIGKCYTADAKIFPNNQDILAGRKKIIEYWTLPEGVRISHHKIMPEEITIVGAIAHDHGYYEGTTTRANGEEVSWKGKYVIVWKKANNQWKIYLDIWNSLKKK